MPQKNILVLLLPIFISCASTNSSKANRGTASVLDSGAVICNAKLSSESLSILAGVVDGENYFKVIGEKSGLIHNENMAAGNVGFKVERQGVNQRLGFSISGEAIRNSSSALYSYIGFVFPEDKERTAGDEFVFRSGISARLKKGNKLLASAAVCSKLYDERFFGPDPGVLPKK